ncbi:hypothetical protein SDC9_62963 [bioreactor metagenome]|uniref:NAD-specific glutamate dehydrogenase n=1 Tax=bioreactor metagenome TaxID=1076179 RepID=A0A644XK65_9ZZZZ
MTPWETRSDLEQFGLFGLQQLVDLIGVLLGGPVQLGLGALALVLADLLVLDQLVDAFLGGPARVAYGDLGVLGLGLGELRVLLAPLGGQLGQHAADGDAVVGRVDAQVGVADRLLHGVDRTAVVRRDEDHPGLGHVERGQLLQRRRGAVVLSGQLVEHRRMGPAGPDGGELLLGELDCMVHLGLRFGGDVADHEVVPFSACGGSAASRETTAPRERERPGRRSVGWLRPDQSFRPSTAMGRRGVSLVDNSTDRFAVDDPHDVALGVEVEEDHRQVVVPGEADRGGVGHLQVAGEVLVVRQGVEPLGARIRLRVAVVHPVDAHLAHQQRIDVHLQAALGRDSVGGEVRHPGPGAEDDHTALLHVPVGAAGDVRLGDLTHLDRGLDPGRDTGLLAEVLQGQAVHHRAEHAHVVGPLPLHPGLLQLDAAEEVAAPYHDAHLHAGLYDLGDLVGDGVDHPRVDADLAPSEGLTGQLQQDAVVLTHEGLLWGASGVRAVCAGVRSEPR